MKMEKGKNNANRFDLSDVKCIKEREGGDDGNSSTKNSRRDG